MTKSQKYDKEGEILRLSDFTFFSSKIWLNMGKNNKKYLNISSFFYFFKFLTRGYGLLPDCLRLFLKIFLSFFIISIFFLSLFPILQTNSHIFWISTPNRGRILNCELNVEVISGWFSKRFVQKVTGEKHLFNLLRYILVNLQKSLILMNIWCFIYLFSLFCIIQSTSIDSWGHKQQILSSPSFLTVKNIESNIFWICSPSFRIKNTWALISKSVRSELCRRRLTLLSDQQRAPPEAPSALSSSWRFFSPFMLWALRDEACSWEETQAAFTSSNNTLFSLTAFTGRFLPLYLSSFTRNTHWEEVYITTSLN